MDDDSLNDYLNNYFRKFEDFMLDNYYRKKHN